MWIGMVNRTPWKFLTKVSIDCEEFVLRLGADISKTLFSISSSKHKVSFKIEAMWQRVLGCTL